MRTPVSILVAISLFVFVGYLVYSGNIVMSDFWTGLAVTLVAIAIGILGWGFKPQVGRFLKEKRALQESKAETVTATKQETELTSIDQHVLLPDDTQITNVNMDNSLFDEIYERAQREAIGIYHDAQLSQFTIQVYPYQKLKNVYLTFYSKWADKTCIFISHSCNRQAKHSPPDKHPIIDSEKRGFTTLPWKESPQWQKFIERAYAKIEPLTPARDTVYHLSAYIPHDVLVWRLNFEDGFSGREHAFTWNGKGFDEGSIVQSS